MSKSELSSEFKTVDTTQPTSSVSALATFKAQSGVPALHQA